jgi:phosphate transport system protein
MLKVGKRKETQILEVKDHINEMFLQLQKMLELSKILLDENSNEIAVMIIEEDQYLDQMQKDLVIEINQVIIKEQPRATDLRIVMGSYALSSDIERIGDYFKNFAKMMLKSNIEERKHQKFVSTLFDEISTRIEDTKIAYASQNHQLAKSIAKRDEDIDQIARQLVNDVNRMLEESNDKSEVKALTRILVLAKTFERAGDHLVNICEQISYIDRGQIYHYS